VAHLLNTHAASAASATSAHQFIGHVITARRAALAGIVGPLLFGGIVVLLDVLQYDFLVATGNSPLSDNPISVNALGPYGWLQTINFFIFGLLVLLFTVGLHRDISHGRGSKIGPALLGIFGVAMLLSSGTIEDAHYSEPTTLHAWLHVIGFLLFLASLTPSFFFMWWRLRKDPRWAGYDWYTLATGVLVVLLLFSDPLKALDSAQHAAWWGAAGRLHLLVGLGWFTVIGSRLWRLSGRTME
jgi:Protein of unknown function (DUF998)